MPRHRRSSRANQPDLFSPPPVRPTWQSLPPEIQQQIRQLLARMLRPSSMRPQGQATPTEVTDE